MVGDDEAPEEKLVAMGETKEASSPPLGRGFAFAEADSDTKRVRFGVLLQTTTTGICPAISGATQNSPCFECLRLVDLSLLNLAHSSQHSPGFLKASEHYKGPLVHFFRHILIWGPQ